MLSQGHMVAMRFPPTMGKLKTGQESTTDLDSNVSISSNSLLVLKATSPSDSDSSILTTAFCSSLSPRLLASPHSSKNLVFGTPLTIASALVELATNSATRAPTLVVFASGSAFQIRNNFN